jgi:hypothetical protein
MLSRFLSTLTVILALLLATTATAQETEKPAIISTIQSQFNAFSKDNFEQAFTYASPFIKSLFGTPKNFGVMVSRSYPMVHRAEDVRFLELRSVAGKLHQKVQVRDAEGRIHFLDYEMIPGENGWEINGVQLIKATGFSA